MTCQSRKPEKLVVVLDLSSSNVMLHSCHLPKIMSPISYDSLRGFLLKNPLDIIRRNDLGCCSPGRSLDKEPANLTFLMQPK